MAFIDWPQQQIASEFLVSSHTNPKSCVVHNITNSKLSKQLSQTRLKTRPILFHMELGGVQQYLSKEETKLQWTRWDMTEISTQSVHS